MRQMVGVAAIASIGAIFLTGCNGGSVFGGEAKPIDTQISHLSGTVLQIASARVAGDRTAVEVRVMNGTKGEIRLNQGRDNSFILTDGGEKMLLVPPAGNTNLSVPAGRSADITLVFDGALPRSGNGTLVLNENGSDSQYSNSPKIQATLPSDRLGGESVPDATAMANLRPNAMTSLRRAAPQGSTLGTGGQGGSNLKVVDALKSELGAVETDRGTIVSLPGDVTFDFNKATIRPDAKPTLDRLLQLVQASSEGTISVEGHTDSRGDDGYNKKLSLDRAEAVKAYLESKGVPADRLSTLGLGETRPTVPNAKPDGTDDEAGRQKNRRVEVVLSAMKASGAQSGRGTIP